MLRLSPWRLLAGALLGGVVVCAQAQTTGPLAVEERGTASYRAASPAAQNRASQQGGGGQGIMLLMQQQQQFEEEIQRLQGLVEELRHELDQMKAAQRERYLDLDARINTLAEQSEPEAPEKSGQDNGPSDPEADRTAYNSAKDKLLKRDFDAAAIAFESYLEAFPKGHYRANAHFWLGKVYSSQKEPDYDQAKAQYQAVAEKYADHSKAPTSLYSLAVLQARAGEVSEAKVNLHKLIKQYPESSEASQAKTLLEQLEQ